MNLIVCLDDRNGMCFNRRRQSRDRELARRLPEDCGGGTLWLAPESLTFFGELPENGRIDGDYMSMASGEDYCFCEDGRWLARRAEVRSIIVYRWNRVYPADIRFPQEELDRRHRTVEAEFAGSSHERITLERYTL